ncbi:hypothetical protein [Escherichia phage EP_H11]|nr:hypothetical protein [Escherichia phage EP_H11]
MYGSDVGPIRRCPSRIFQSFCEKEDITDILKELGKIKGAVVSEPCRVFRKSSNSTIWQIRITMYSVSYANMIHGFDGLQFEEIENPYSLRVFKDHTIKEESGNAL